MTFTYSGGGDLVEGRHSLVDLLNFGSTGGIGVSGGACSIGYPLQLLHDHNELQLEKLKFK